MNKGLLNLSGLAEKQVVLVYLVLVFLEWEY